MNGRILDVEIAARFEECLASEVPSSLIRLPVRPPRKHGSEVIELEWLRLGVVLLTVGEWKLVIPDFSRGA